MLVFMGCEECGTSRGNYSAECVKCKVRKRRSQQQRNRRSGNPEKRVQLSASRARELAESRKHLQRALDFLQFAIDNPHEVLETQSVVNLSLQVNLAISSLDICLEDLKPYLESVGPEPIRPYRSRRKSSNYT